MTAKLSYIYNLVKIKDLNNKTSILPESIIETKSKWLINKNNMKWKYQLYNRNYTWLYKVFLSKRSNLIKEELLKKESSYFLDLLVKEEKAILSLSEEGRIYDDKKEKNSEIEVLTPLYGGYKKALLLNDNSNATNDISNNIAGVKLSSSYVNILNDKFNLKNLFNITIRVNKIKHIDYKNIIIEKYNNIIRRKMENKLTLPHYFFTPKYVAKSMTTQLRSWPNTIYSFMKPTMRNIKYLDSITGNLIKLFLNPISLKGKLVKGKKGEKKGIGGISIVPIKTFGKYMNEVIKFTSNRSREGMKDVVDYTSSILTLPWFKSDLNWVRIFRKFFKERRTGKIIGYLPKKRVVFNKARRIFLSRPLFRHTAFNVIIDLFVYNNKSYKLGKFHNMLKIRAIYKYMYSMYVNYSHIIQNIMARPRIFYINLIDPKIHYYYSNVLESYEKILISLSKNEFIFFLIFILKKNLNSKISSQFSRFFRMGKSLINNNNVIGFDKRMQSNLGEDSQNFLDYSKNNILNLLNNNDSNNNKLSLNISNNDISNNDEINDKSASSFSKLVNRKLICLRKDRRGNLKSYAYIVKKSTQPGVKNISNNVNNYISKSLRLNNNINKHISTYNIEKKNIYVNNFIHFINSKIIQGENNAKLWWWNNEFYLLKEQGVKLSKASMKKQYLEDLERKSKIPVRDKDYGLSGLKISGFIEEKNARRVKVFGKDKFTLKKYKWKVSNGKKWSKLDPKFWKEQTMKYNLYSAAQKANTNPNQKWVYDNKTKLKVHISKYNLDNLIFDKIKDKKKKMKLIGKNKFNKNTNQITQQNNNMKKNVPSIPSYIIRFNKNNDIKKAVNNKDKFITRSSNVSHEKTNKFNNINKINNNLIDKVYKSNHDYKNQNINKNINSNILGKKNYNHINKNDKYYDSNVMNNKRRVHTWTNFFHFESSKMLAEESKKNILTLLNLNNKYGKIYKKNKYSIISNIKDNNSLNRLFLKNEEKTNISPVLGIVVRKKYSNYIKNIEIKWRKDKLILNRRKKNHKLIEYSKYNKLNNWKNIDWWKVFINYWSTKKNISYIYKERHKINIIKNVKHLYYINKGVKSKNLFSNLSHIPSHLASCPAPEFVSEINSKKAQLDREKINIGFQNNYSENLISKNKLIWDKLDYSIMKMIVKLTMNQNNIATIHNNKKTFFGNTDIKTGLINKKKYNILNENIKKNNNEIENKVENNLISSYLSYSYEKVVGKIRNHISNNDKLYIDIIKQDFYNINRDVIVNKTLEVINYESNTINNSYNFGYYNTNIYNDVTIRLNRSDGYSSRIWQTLNFNRREDNLMHVLRFSDKVFKPYYRYLIRLFILNEYKIFVNKLGYINLIIHCYIPVLFNKFRWFKNNNLKIFNFIGVRTLFNLFAFNYRSLYIIKPKYYYINKYRFYNKKANRLKFNTWLRSIKYLKALRKAPNNYWLRYHNLIKFYYRRVLKFAKWDTERKVLTPYVLYFEDLLYNIYGKLALIRIWPLKRFFLSSYILSERLMLLLDKKANLSRRRKNITSIFTRFVFKFINVLNVTKIDKIYDFNLENSSRWPNELISAINKDLPIASNYNKLEYYSKKLEAPYSLNSYLIRNGNLDFYLPIVKFYYYSLAKNIYFNIKGWKKKKFKLDTIFKKGLIKYWTRPIKNYIMDITSNQDISGIEFRLAGRARSKARAFSLIYQHGSFLGARHYNKITQRYLTITNFYLRNTLKSSMDFTQRSGNFTPGTTNLKLWYSSLLSSDIMELLAYILKMKEIFKALINRNYIINSNIKYFINYYKWTQFYTGNIIRHSMYFKIKQPRKLNIRNIKFTNKMNLLKNKLFSNYWSINAKKLIIKKSNITNNTIYSFKNKTNKKFNIRKNNITYIN